LSVDAIGDVSINLTGGATPLIAEQKGPSSDEHSGGAASGDATTAPNKIVRIIIGNDIAPLDQKHYFFFNQV